MKKIKNAMIFLVKCTLFFPTLFLLLALAIICLPGRLYSIYEKEILSSKFHKFTDWVATCL